ncbi:MAG: hypothetical protein BGO01_19310 [Armatimonadetes bacterium 55-13]|nr:hypothetical protein [Armatimonadota bacterium]OJU64269.1 MAG: hypothetical protein BGO01_19310 [Armatimonadetes bacterium 55-13]
MMLALIFTTVIADINPFVQLPPPIALYRDRQSGSDWVRANDSIAFLARKSGKEQIAFQLKFLERARSELKTHGLKGEKYGRRYDWYPTYDIGKLDLLRVAMGKPILLHRRETFLFLKRSPTGGLAFNSACREDSGNGFSFGRPEALMSESDYSKAKKLVISGAFVLPQR